MPIGQSTYLPTPWLLAVSFVIALALAAAVTPVAIRVARGAGAVVRPGGRRVHTAPMPTWGGLGMLVAFLTTIALVFAVATRRGMLGDIPPHYLRGVLLGATLAALLGAVDDRFELRALPKLLGQIACACVPLAFGVTITGLAGHPIPFWLGGVLTVGWIVCIMNAINLIDGLDGLAAGVVSIASLALALVALERGQIGAAVMSVSLAGAAVGFLPYNFNPARIFMGDLGSHFLGYIAAAIAVLGTFKITASLVLLTPPVVAFAVPIFDTLWAMIRRYRAGDSIAKGDRNHIHHRLIDLGLSQRQAVLLIYLVTVVFSTLAVMISRYS